jgi:hypothetical protein
MRGGGYTSLQLANAQNSTRSRRRNKKIQHGALALAAEAHPLQTLRQAVPAAVQVADLSSKHHVPSINRTSVIDPRGFRASRRPLQPEKERKTCTWMGGGVQEGGCEQHNFTISLRTTHSLNSSFLSLTSNQSLAVTSSPTREISVKLRCEWWLHGTNPCDNAKQPSFWAFHTYR